MVFTLLGGILLASCGREAPEKPAPSRADAGIGRAVPRAYTVNYPLKYFAERIGGEYIEVVFPAMEGDPAYWNPDADTVRAFQEADLILLNGAGYAKWVDKVTLPGEKLVDTSKAWKDRYVLVEDAMTHSHGPEGAHVHAGTAFTTWLDLSFAIEQARAIQEAFSSLLQEKGDAFQKHFDALAKDLSGLDRRIKDIVAAKKDQPLVGSHPVYQYLARRYGLNMKSVHWEPDEAPDAAMWMEFEKMLSGHPAQWMIWEGEPMDEVVKRLETLGVKSLVFDPCGNTPEEGDFLSVMKRNMENLEAAF
jgi:zinc transport system substrate-binding protein